MIIQYELCENEEWVNSKPKLTKEKVF